MAFLCCSRLMIRVFSCRRSCAAYRHKRTSSRQSGSNSGARPYSEKIHTRQRATFAECWRAPRNPSRYHPGFQHRLRRYKPQWHTITFHANMIMYTTYCADIRSYRIQIIPFDRSIVSRASRQGKTASCSEGANCSNAKTMRFSKCM